MFRHLLLLAPLVSVAFSWCTPFIACNQTIYGDFSDPQKGLKVVLLGRPFQKSDELIVTGEFYNNGSDVMDDSTFMFGMSKGIIMHQLGCDVEDYLLTTTFGANEDTMNVTGEFRRKGVHLVSTLKSPNATCDEPFTFKIRSVDGYGFAFGGVTNFTDKQAYQYTKPDRAQAVFFNGQFKTSKMELKCNDYVP